MTHAFHPEPATLMAYAAGGLDEPFAIVVAAHAEGCRACRTALSEMNAIGGEVALESGDAPEADEIARMMGRLESEPTPLRLPPAPADSGATPAALARLLGGGLDKAPWRPAGQGIETHRVKFTSPRGETGLRFVRVAPGFAIPEHGHPGAEMVLVLEGCLKDGERMFRAGDVCEQDETVRHEPVAEGAQACICVIAEEGQPLFGRSARGLGGCAGVGWA